jgi:hypothetical protein
MQIWPWWTKDPHAAAVTARSMSTSSSTISAEFPPSSRCTRLSRRPAISPMCLPTEVDPVNETTRVSGWVTTASPVSGPPGSTCSSPSGRPASSNARAIATPPATAVRVSGLRITALPSARAGATERIASTCGKLNGAMTPVTPTGTRMAIDSRGFSDGSSSP